jgi:hypothetical protein
MKKFILFLFATTLVVPCLAENYLINGGQESQINYQMIQKVVPAAGTQKLILSYVEPATFASPTFNQKIATFNLNFSSAPSSREENFDKRGNKIIKVVWNKPSTGITATLSLSALNQTKLQQLQTRAPFPLTGLSTDVQAYLAATEQVPAKNPQILSKAKQITTSSKTEFDAVQQVLSWVVDHMQYVLTPESYAAMYSFQSGKGNCQNYSHLSAALMRAVGIPARIVNGITLKEAYDVKTGNGVFTLRMAQGRHSWIEVYFPDLGWVPLDPQQTELFVSNRFIRVETGLDNEETCNDGLIRWTQSGRNGGQPQFEEVIEAAFVSDLVNLSADKQTYGPKKLLFCPPVEASFTKVALAPQPPPPKKITPIELSQLQYDKPEMIGNLEFPQNIDFLSTRGPAQEAEGGQMEMRKNFLVETAEYVTTQGNQYAQTFILKKPMKMGKVGLALHKFGGDGQLWLEILKDDGSGKPGDLIATSEIMPVSAIKFAPGYSWIDFDYSKEMPTLSPGRYWIALGFTGSPIINWFFSYGKPVGPEDGTRYKTMFDETWSRSLAYEFNYRVVGMASE